MLKRLLFLSLVLLLCALPAGICSAEAVYPITETELTRLNQIFDQLQTNNNEVLAQLTASQQDLTAARQQLAEYQAKLAKSQQELAALQSQLGTYKIDLMTAKQNLIQAQTSLDKANQSLQQYAKEEQSEKTKLKLERDIGYVVALYFAVRK